MSNEMKKSMKTLRERAKEFDVLLPFMEGRDKGETRDLLGTVNTIIDYGFLTDRDKGESFAAFIVKERPNKFYFGGTVITERLSTLDGEGYRDAILEEGLPVLMTEKQAKKGGRRYTSVEFFPEG